MAVPPSWAGGALFLQGGPAIGETVKKQAFAWVCASLLLGATAAKADNWPGSVVGSWAVLGNHSPGTLVISSQASTGLCRAIAGTIYGNPIEGFYCRYSGRIVFARKNNASNDTTQVWSGNLSEANTVLRMAGTFAVVNSGGGSFGEYNFNASK